MKYLSDYMQAKQTELFAKTGTFFAFSQDQISEKAKPGTKYYHAGHGMYCPSSYIDELLAGLERIHGEAIKTDFEENGAKAIIEREYFNHETQITLDNSRLFAVLQPYMDMYPEQFDKITIHATIKECFDLAVTNDWF